ncbi:MAG: lysophospholipid acyltransferase family protein [Candidatus Cloacimonetes bacterium]|jgi:KDO2-lipid IV(A) lauroyltransferase|nr:lysophospholipid acyltransferase family protein [Candidatus Cloacimonadota bacterium]MDD4157312.1 lysophospholipid acyltransferase family protein [Candidatus Cloacimonadota bacterium]
MKFLNKIQNLAEYFLFRLSVSFFKSLPEKLTIFILKKLLLNAGIRFGLRKKIVVNQLKLCFPKKNNDEILSLSKKVYEELAISIAEIFILSDKFIEKRSTAIGLENIDDALKLNRGVIIVSAHYSNWELGAKIVAKKYPPVYGVVKNQRNPYFNAYIDKKRKDNNLETIPMQNALKHIISALKNNNVVAFLIDQYAKHQGTEFTFLNHKTKTYTSVAQIALKYQVPVIMAFDVRDKDLIHKTYFHKPLLFENIPYNQKNILDITKKINHYIEVYIKDHPELWFWVHRKWR